MFENAELTPATIPIIAAAVIQFLRIFPPIAKLIAGKEKDILPILSMLLSVGLAYLTKVPNPIVAGVLLGLAASGGYDLLHKKAESNG